MLAATLQDERLTLTFPVYPELDGCESQREICEEDQKENFHFPDNKKVPTLPHLFCFFAENGYRVWNSRNHLDQINQSRRRNLEVTSLVPLDCSSAFLVMAPSTVAEPLPTRRGRQVKQPGHDIKNNVLNLSSLPLFPKSASLR